MRITRQGVDPATILHKATCSNCKTEYEFLRNDPEITVKPSFDQRDQGMEEAKFTCKTCGHEVTGYLTPGGR